MKNIEMILVDRDHSVLSHRLSDKFIQSPFFSLVNSNVSSEMAEKEMLRNKTDMIIVIPEGFEHELYKDGKVTVQLQIDAINGMTAGLINAYASQIISGFNLEFLQSSGNNALVSVAMKNIDIRYSFWYNAS
jgi:ABC-2 type transport system permease protein